MAAHEKLGQVAPGDGPLDEFLAALQQGGTVDSQGEFTLDREKARAKMQRFRLAEPARYILELVQAAVLRGAPYIRFEISETQVRMMCPAAPFSVQDFEVLYDSLFARGQGGQRQALRHLALGLCTLMAMGSARVKVSGGGSDGASLVMRPGARDVYKKGGDAEHGLLVEVIGPRSRSPHAETSLLLDSCGLSMVPIELNGMPITSGYQLPGALHWASFQQGSTRGLVAVAIESSGALSPTSLHLMRNGISFEKDIPAGLLPGFLALIESPLFHLDISHRRIVRNEAFTEALQLILEQQLRLLAGDCERFCRGTWPHSPALLRRLLLGLLESLGSLDPLARWAGRHGQFPRAAPPLFPEQVPGVDWLMDAAVFPTVDHRAVSLRQVLADWRKYGSVSVARSRTSVLTPQSPLVLLAQSVTEFNILSRILGSRSVEQLSYFHPNRVANMERWRKRQQEITLLSPPNLLRVKLPPGSFGGEVGVEIPLGNQAESSPHGQLSLTFLHMDGVLSAHKLPCPVRGLHAILAGEFSPTPDWDDVQPDDRLATAVGVLLQTLPILAAAIVLECQSLLQSAETGPALRAAVRGLLLLAASENEQKSLIGPLGLRHDQLSVLSLHQELIEILRTEQIANTPLFESVQGRVLSLRDLEQECDRRGAIAGVARRSAADFEFVEQRDRWAQLATEATLPRDLLLHALPMWVTLPQGQPKFVIWFDGAMESLAQLFRVLWGGPVLEDVRHGLNELRSVHDALLPQGDRRHRFMWLAARLWLTVPIPKHGGQLGLLRHEYQHRGEALVRVWLHREGHASKMTLCTLPVGGLLMAQVDLPTLRTASSADAKDDGVDRLSLQRALHRALLALCEKMSEPNEVPYALRQRIALAIATTLFPRRTFRVNYDRLRWQVVRSDGQEQEVDREHRRILSLSQKHSVEAVHSALAHLLGQSPNQPVTAQQIAGWLIERAVEQTGAVPLAGEDATEYPAQMAAEDPGVLDFLDLFFSPTGSFLQRACQPVAALRSLPVCQDVHGGWLSLADVLDEVQRHGDVQVLPTGASDSNVDLKARRVLSEAQTGDALSALQCLLGDFRVRMVDPDERTPLGKGIELFEDEDDGEHPADPEIPQTAPVHESARAAADPDPQILAQRSQVAEPERGVPRVPPAPDPQALSAESPAPQPVPLPASVSAQAVSSAVHTSEHQAELSSETLDAVERDASLWLRISHAAAQLIEALRPGQQRRAEREAQVLATLLCELRLIAGDDSPLLSQINLSRIRFASVASRQAVLCTKYQTLINRRHPSVRRVLTSIGKDPAVIWFLCAAVYTALNVFFEEVTDEDEAQFLALLCRRAKQVLDTGAPSATAS